MHEVYTNREQERTGDRKKEKAPQGRANTKGRWGGVLFGLGASLLLA